MNSGWPSVSRNVRASVGLVERMLGDLAGQLRRRGAIERAQRDRRQQVVAFELSKQPHERRVVLLLFRRERCRRSDNARPALERTK